MFNDSSLKVACPIIHFRVQSAQLFIITFFAGNFLSNFFELAGKCFKVFDEVSTKYMRIRCINFDLA